MGLDTGYIELSSLCWEICIGVLQINTTGGTEVNSYRSQVMEENQRNSFGVLNPNTRESREVMVDVQVWKQWGRRNCDLLVGRFAFLFCSVCSTYWITTNTLEDATFLSNATIILKGFLSRLKICSTKDSVGTATLWKQCCTQLPRIWTQGIFSKMIDCGWCIWQNIPLITWPDLSSSKQQDLICHLPNNFFIQPIFLGF